MAKFTTWTTETFKAKAIGGRGQFYNPFVQQNSKVLRGPNAGEHKFYNPNQNFRTGVKGPKAGK